MLFLNGTCISSINSEFSARNSIYKNNSGSYMGGAIYIDNDYYLNRQIIIVDNMFK